MPNTYQAWSMGALTLSASVPWGVLFGTWGSLGWGEGCEAGETRPTAHVLSSLQELEDLQKELPRYLGKLFSDDANVLVWHALLLPVSIQGTVASGWGHRGQGGLVQEPSLR